MMRHISRGGSRGLPPLRRALEVLMMIYAWCRTRAILVSCGLLMLIPITLIILSWISNEEVVFKIQDSAWSLQSSTHVVLENTRTGCTWLYPPTHFHETCLPPCNTEGHREYVLEVPDIEPISAIKLGFQRPAKLHVTIKAKIVGGTRDGEWTTIITVSLTDVPEPVKEIYFPPVVAHEFKVVVNGKSSTEHVALYSIALGSDCAGCSHDTWKPTLHCPSDDMCSGLIGNDTVQSLIDGDGRTAVEIAVPGKLTFRIPDGAAIAGIAIRGNPTGFKSFDLESGVVEGAAAPEGPFSTLVEFDVLYVPPNRQKYKYIYTPRTTLPYIRVRFLKAREAETVVLADLQFAATCSGGVPAGVDGLYAVHFHRALNRREATQIALSKLGYEAQWRSSWTRDRVLNNKEEIARMLWPGATTIKKGGYVTAWVGTKRKAWEEVQKKQVKTKKMLVDSRFLGKVANLRQHFEIYELAQARNHSDTLVIEDDSTFIMHFPKFFARVMSEVPKDYDMVFIGTCLSKHANQMFRESERVSPRLWKVREHRCANGYIISQKAVNKLLSSSWARPPDYRGIDGYLETLMGDVIPEVYWTEPSLIYEGSKAYGSGMWSSLRDLW